MENLVFILGAGASQPLKFPVAYELLSQIADLRDDGTFHGIAAEYINTTEWRRFFQFARTHTTVDALVGTKESLSTLGSLAVAYCILKCEKEETTLVDAKLYKLFCKYMGYVYGNPQPAHSCSFITLNYDRSLELFLRTSLASFVDEDREEQVDDIIVNLPIRHLHGSLGTLSEIPYGSMNPASYVDAAVKVSQAARTIRMAYHSEHDENGEHYKKARKMISEATRIFIIGCGYDTTIFKKLFKSDSEKMPPVYGTLWKDHKDVWKKISEIFGDSNTFMPSEPEQAPDEFIEKMMATSSEYEAFQHMVGEYYFNEDDDELSQDVARIMNRRK